jgi:hypothetical protein
VTLRWRNALALGAGLWLALAPPALADPPAIVQQEVGHLLRYIGNSGCAFKRNGTWNDARAAQAHAREKYDFLVTLGRIDTTRDFIEKAATSSSLTGEPYEVRCGTGATVSSNRWLGEELSRYRAARRL